MYTIQKSMEIAGAHNLTLDYESKCHNLHGHNWVVTVYCKTRKLNNNGMVIDFTHIKKAVHDKLDHQYLNDILSFNPTAENMSKWIASQVPHCYKVSVQESSGNIASWEADTEDEVLEGF